MKIWNSKYIVSRKKRWFNWYKNKKRYKDLKILKEEVVELQLDFAAHLSSAMPHMFQDLKEDRVYRYGYQLSIDGIPQVISEEVIV